MIRGWFYFGELAAFGAALVLSILIHHNRWRGHQDIFIVQVPIGLKAGWACYLCYLVIANGWHDVTPNELLATISQSLTFLMGLCMALLFAKRAVGRRA